MPLHVRVTFGTFLLAVPCKTTTPSDQIIGYVENVNTRRFSLSFLLSLFELESHPYEFSSIQSRQIISTNWNNCKVISKSASFFFLMTCPPPFCAVFVVVSRAPYYWTPSYEG